MMAALVIGSRAEAQACATTVARSAPAGLSGLRVRSVNVRVDSGDAPMRLSFLQTFRTRTREEVVSRELLLATGGEVDSARIAESLRRLRALRLFADISLEVTRCSGSDSVDLSAVVRDAWTLRSIARITPPATVSLGLEDRNLFGTGRTVSATSDQTAGGHGGSIAATDPWLFGTNLIGAARASDVAGTHTARGAIRHDEWPFVDPWRYELAVSRQRLAELPGAIHRGTFSVVGALGHMIGDPRQIILVPYIATAIDEAESVVPGSQVVLDRRFSGAGLGLHRRALRFDTLGWFTRQRGLLDIPLGWQSDMVAAPGYDRSQRAPAAHYDLWAGRMWIPAPGRLVMADFWTSGYVGNVRHNHIDRASGSAFADAARGFWGVRVMSEQLLGLDQDLRSLSLAGVGADPSFPAVPFERRGSNRSLMSSMERSVHLHAIGRGSMLDAALFGGASVRWDTPDVPGAFRVAVAGARLRLFSASGIISSTRIDLSYPVASGGGSTVHRPLFSVSVASLLDAPHQREGRRLQ
jgi:hypothetical protein